MVGAVHDSCTFAGTQLCLNDHYLCETFCLGWMLAIASFFLSLSNNFVFL